MYKFKLAVLGGGNMATAIIRGIINAKVLKPSEIIVSDPSEARRSELADLGVYAIADNSEIVKSSKYLIIAVKPQVANEVLSNLSDDFRATNVISIMAGTCKSKISEMIKKDVKVARIMPNLPATVKTGMSAIDASDFSEEDKNFVFEIFDTIGKTIALDESYFDAVTSISGSGPAYVYMFIEAMIKGGIEGGLSEDISKMLTLQTIKGAVAMVESQSTPISTLIDNVCSKGGTTIQAVEHYRNNNLEGIISDGIKKCKNRSEELSKL